MHRIEVSLSDELMEFLEQQVKSGGYEDAGEYLQGLLDGEQRRQTRHFLEAQLLHALTTGEPREMTEADWDELEQRVCEQAEARKTA